MAKQIKAWEIDRNRKKIKIHWSFTVNNAHEKLARHYYEVFNQY